MPGAMLTYTIRQSLSAGRRSGLIITAGHALLELLLILLIFLGFDTILQSKIAQIAIGLAGGLFLVYMGGDMIFAAVRNRVSVEVKESSAGGRGMFLSGILLSASNPYFLLWWAVVGLGFLTQSYASYGAAGVAVYYFGHISADFLWYGLISTVIGTTRKFISGKLYRILIALLGGVLLFFGGKFIVGAFIDLGMHL